MKKFKLIALAFALTAFGACNKDEDDPDPVTGDNISGIYFLTEVNTATATDLNGDGMANTNQKLESNCYNDSRMVFNADHSFTYYRNGITLDEANMTISCTSNTYTGTWQVESGSTTAGVINVEYIVNGNETSLLLNKSGNEITNSQPLAEYPSIDGSGNPVYVTGEVTTIFVK